MIEVVHDYDTDHAATLRDVFAWVDGRLAGRVPHPRQPRELPAITRGGSGSGAAWAALRDVIFPTTFPTDHPRYLAFVGGSPTADAVIADAALSAAAVYGGSELEAGVVVAAERAALRWLSGLIGYPEEAHGTFVSGGSMANLSALVAARHGRTSSSNRPPSVLVVGASAHSSVRAAAAIMGCEVVIVGTPDMPLTGSDLEPVLARYAPADLVAVVASAGATNTGWVDHLDEVAAVCERHGAWLHVDAAYGGAALLSPAVRGLFTGIDRANSVTIDPHKWLFTPFDCAAIIYREPEVALAAHRQDAAYLDVVHDGDNPADYAVHLTRRARGIPLWTSLVANGTDAYLDAVERCLATATHAAKSIEASEVLALAMEPQLSVVLFERLGWNAADYVSWSRSVRERGLALVTPTRFAGRTMLRLCFVNPLTTPEDVNEVLASLIED